MLKQKLVGYRTWKSKSSGEIVGRFFYLRDCTPVDNQAGAYGQAVVEDWIPKQQISEFTPGLIGKEFVLNYGMGFRGPEIASIEFSQDK